MAGAATPVVEMRGITITFPGVKALDNVDFQLVPGEVNALMGENGAGKSTLIKALTGVYRLDSGTIIVDGAERHLRGTADAQRAGISTVYQEVNLCANLSIGENVMLGHEARGPLGVNWKATHAAASKVLDGMGLGHLDTRKPLATLSIAMQQLVALSRAMVIDSKVLILDEPTSSLDANEVDTLFGVLRGLRDKGVAILFVSHFIDQVYALSDRITVLRNGRYIGEYRTAELPRNELISLMIGKDLETLASLGSSRQQADHDHHEPPLLSARGLTKRGSIHPIDLDVYPGEILGFAGLLGSGRSELARLLYGADKADAGTISIKGKPVSLHSPLSGLSAGVAYSTENRRDEGIVGDLSVHENLILAVQAGRGWMRPLPGRKADELVETYVRELNVRPPDPDRMVKNLSGGNQQKVLLGRWLATLPELLILDEPTRGIDVGAKAEIQEVVARLAQQGTAVIFISSELEEVVRMSDRIVVLKDREKIAELRAGPDVTVESIVETIARHGVGGGEAP